MDGKALRPFLTPKGQIDHLKSKGVKFDIIPEKDALLYLENNNNYFKLRAYRKNFPKVEFGKNIGQYIDLDFAMLKDLSIIDMRLRYVLIHMALDIEHFAKVRLLEKIKTKYPDEDGYAIVASYFDHLKLQDSQNTGSSRFPNLEISINKNMNNPYCGGIISKYKDNFPVWAFLEVVPLGTLIDFYGFCGRIYQDKQLTNEYYLLLRIRQLRNAAAHNNCIIYDMGAVDSKKKPDFGLLRAISSISSNVRKARLANEKNIQICSLLYMHREIVYSEGVHNRAKDALTEFTDRMFRNKDYYYKNELILSTFDFYKKVIDILFF